MSGTQRGVIKRNENDHLALVRLPRVSQAELYTHVCPEYVLTDGERVVQPQALQARS